MTFSAKRSWFGMPGLASILLLTAGLAPAQNVRVVMPNGDRPPGPFQLEIFCPDGESFGGFNRNPVNDANKRASAFTYGRGCRWRANMPGYISSTPLVTPSADYSRRTITRIIVYPVDQTEGGTFSATSALAPEEARKAFENGMDAVKDENWKDAAKSFTKAVKTYDRYAEAWYQLGKVFRKLENPDAAHRALLNAVVADPRYPPPYEDLSQLAFERNDMEDLLQQTEMLLSLDPYGFPGAYYYSAVANLRLKHYEAGEERIRAAIENDPDQEQPMEYFVLGFLLMNQGAKAEALDAFDTFLTLQPEGDSADQARAAMEKLQKRFGQQ